MDRVSLSWRGSTATKQGVRRRTRGEIETLPSGALRVRVYAGIDPVTGKRHYLVEDGAASRDTTVLGMTCGRTRRLHYVRKWQHRRWVRLPESTIVALCGATIDPRCEPSGEFWALCERCDMTYYIPPPPPGEPDELHPRTGRR